MQRQALVSVAAVLTLGSGSVLAQGGDLSSVTMRVLDDVSDVDAVVLALDASRGDGQKAAERDGRDAAADDADRQPAADTAADDRRDLRGARGELHDLDVDERSEGRLEDRDVERPAVPPPAAP